MRLRGRDFGATPVVMAIVNRTPDSFYDRGATFGEEAAMAAVATAVAAGADIVDIGGVKAGPGATVTAQAEADRVVPFIQSVRATYPDLIISVDTWRADVADAACRAGADLLNDAWGGVDPELAVVAAAHSAGLVCTHTGGQPPRTRPHRVAYPDVMADVVSSTLDLAHRAEAAGVEPESILLDPGHDFGKNTRHSLEVTRRLPELVATGRPVLVSLSNKDFIGESLDRPVSQRLAGTLAATAVAAWLGAQVFRAHNVPETRDAVDMVAALRTGRPRLSVRGLA
jgi:dihydropteroate synthase